MTDTIATPVATETTAPTTPEKPSVAKETPIEAAIRKHKVKVNGQEFEVDDNELKSGYQTRKAADERFRAAAEKERRAEEMYRLLKEDPIALLKHPELGLNAQEIAEKLLLEKFDEEMLTDEQKELRNTKNKLSEFEKKQQEEAELKQKEVEKQKTDAGAKAINDMIVRVLKAHPKLPPTNQTVKRMAQYAIAVINDGRGDEINEDQIADWVYEDYKEEQKSLLSSLSDDQLFDYLGEELYNKVKKSERKSASNNPLVTPTGQKPNDTSEKAEKKKKGKMRSSDFFRERRLKNMLE